MRKLLLIALSLLLITSCSFRSGDEESHEKAVLPDIILENADYTLGQRDENPIYINSTRMTFFSHDHKAIVENISFTSYNDDGSIAVEGSAGHGEIDTDSRTMNLSGGVSLKASSGDMMIEAESLIFDSENGEIEADGNVRVSSEDGVFAGTGFRGDLLEEVYAFRTITEGVFEL
ncbi:MAG: LPS export ABC transporter periplasmic protein LptC [Spirochaetes bacterium]|uniref:LPS export ABC transporter periplasmic protein LptC n=1 Tax=Candidatus Ornithospirochaeta stercoripullorum TaxID=2840899 RepID=A0A9D9H4D5_9SPIO|nr:LPS export ABC transporter periplasmic protein LptC [Candidatus Ornithospirochaeta stercoripullorum]